MTPEFKRGMWVGFHLGLLISLVVITTLLIVSRYA